MSELYEFNKIFNKEDKTWMVDLSCTHLACVQKYLENDNISSSGIDTIVLNASRVVGYCPNPALKTECKRTGLVIGKVQSGKTSSFITSAAIAFDNGYDVVIILGGTKIDLVKQNKSRIEEYFKNDSEVIVLDTETNKALINADEIKKHILSGRKKVIIVSLKSAGKIDMLHEQLFNDSYFKNKPVLIFDDEGDEYSPNGKARKGLETSTYASIKHLLDNLLIRAFISVTATPQANLLLSTLDILSPDFGILVEPGEGYCGLDVFHDGENPYCITIPDEEISLLDEGSIPSSFYEALSTYFVASAIYKIREKEPKKLSMLIHPSWKVEDLKIVKIKTDKIIEKWNHLALNRDDIAFDNLKNHMREAYEHYKSNDVEVGEFDDILNEALEVIQYCKVHLVTGEQKVNDNDTYYNNNIYIGGQIVGRGLTIKGLVVTYIIRIAKGVSNVDTVEQRARWFGYKQSILDLCRVFATKKNFNNFENIREHEENMWETIKNNHINGSHFKEMKRLYILNDSLRMTRPNVAKTKSYNFQNWNIEKKFQSNKDSRQYNDNLIKDFKRKYENQMVKDYIGNQSYHKVLSNVSFNWIVNNLLVNYQSPDDGICDVRFLSTINNYLAKSGIETKCDLVFMRDYKESFHEIDQDGTIHNYMVGRRPKNVPEEECTYKGDRQYRKGDIITIQIHNICNKFNNEQHCPILAVYVPESICNELVNIIVPE